MRYGLLSLAGTEKTRELMNAILDKEKADMAIVNATVLNVYTGEVLEDNSVAIKGEWIAFVGHDSKDTIGPDTHVIDAAGKTIIPGLIDGHTHIVWLYSASEFIRYAMGGGTTTIIYALQACSLISAKLGGYSSRIRRLAFSSKRGNSPIFTISTSGVMVIRYLKVSTNCFTACSILSLEISCVAGSTLIFRCFPVPIGGTTI